MPGADFLQLDTGQAPAGGLADWLAERLRGAICDGRLPVGSRLPATRTLAADLRVSRGVVTEAYQRLTEDGHVAGQGRNGTVVVAAPRTAGPSGAGTNGLPGVVTAGMPGSVVGPGTGDELFGLDPGVETFDALRAAQGRVDLSPGVPDLAAFPRAAWLRAERTVLSEVSAAEFGYSDPRGAPALRLAVSRWLARNRGIRVDPGEVIIVCGVAQALGLMAQVLRAEGIGAVAVEDPGSLGTRQHLHSYQLATPPVPVDSAGARVDALAATGAAAVLLTPAHQFPAGVVLDGERRRELMGWAGAGGLVIEDDYDAEHRYDRPPVPALRSMLAEQVCYTGSVSKLLAPALRIGWMIPPPRYHAALVAAKRFADLGNALLPQLVLAALMESGELERQLRFLRKRHRRRRDAMIGAIREHLPGAAVHGAAAGLHLMITFDAGFADTDLAAAAIADGVKVHPLSWHRQRPGPPGLVLGYAARTPTDIAEGIAVLGAALGRAGLSKGQY
jgi:GntR family transcriptional regulator / MocR family aminotransferase